MKTIQLAVRAFFDTDVGRTEIEVADGSHDAIYLFIALLQSFLWKNPLIPEIICLSLTIAFRIEFFEGGT